MHRNRDYIPGLLEQRKTFGASRRRVVLLTSISSAWFVFVNASIGEDGGRRQQPARYLRPELSSRLTQKSSSDSATINFLSWQHGRRRDRCQCRSQLETREPIDHLKRREGPIRLEHPGFCRSLETPYPAQDRRKSKISHLSRNRWVEAGSTADTGNGLGSSTSLRPSQDTIDEAFGDTLHVFLFRFKLVDRNEGKTSVRLRSIPRDTATTAGPV